MIPYVTADHVSALSDLGVAGAAIFAAWQGIKSLGVWRNERLGSRKIEIAEEALTQFFKVDHALKAIRSPIGSASESDDREAGAAESAAEKNGRDLGHATWKRMQSYADLFQEFYTTSLKLKVYFGDEIYEECEKVRMAHHRIRVAAQMMFNTPYDGYQDQKFREKLERDIWNMESEDDESIEQIMKSVVQKAEALLAPHLRKA